MIAGSRVFFRALGDLWFNLIGFSTCNLLVFALSLLIIPAPPLWIGLLDVSRDSLPYRERPEVGMLLASAKTNFGRAWKLALLHLVGSVIFFGSFYFYFSAMNRAVWALPLAVVTGVICWTWLGVIMYSSPLLLRSTGGVIMALRNGLVVMVHYPLFTTTLFVLSIPVLIASILVPPLSVLVSVAFFAILGTRATNWVLEKEGIIRNDEDNVDDQPPLS